MRNPWTAIWTSPREAVRAAVAQDREREMYVVAMIAGLGGTLDNLARYGIGEHLSLPWILPVWAASAALTGWISLLLVAGLFRWTGSWFGGEASPAEMRHACAWPCVITLPTAAMTVVLALVYGRSLFTSDSLLLTGSVADLPLLAAVALALGVVLGVWAMVASVLAISEVQGLSVGRAVASVTLPVAAIILVGGSIAVLLG